MSRFYIATTLSNHEAHNIVRDILHGVGHRITVDWTELGNAYENGYEGLASRSALDLSGIRAADWVIVLLPGGKGTHLELGYALALEKRVALYSFEHRPNDKTACVFHHDPGIEIVECANTELVSFARTLQRAMARG